MFKNKKLYIFTKIKEVVRYLISEVNEEFIQNIDTKFREYDWFTTFDLSENFSQNFQLFCLDYSFLTIELVTVK